jgi:putative phosphoesterase
MKIGILSDTHSDQATLLKALEQLRQLDINLLLHCGDIDDSSTLRLLEGWTVHLVFGNNDWDQKGLQNAADEIEATFHDPFGHLELDGVNLAFTHGHETGLLRDLINSRHYDYVFHGHTHQFADQRVGPTRVINPGALYRARPRSCIALDLATGQVERLIAG